MRNFIVEVDFMYYCIGNLFKTSGSAVEIILLAQFVFTDLSAKIEIRNDISDLLLLYSFEHY